MKKKKVKKDETKAIHLPAGLVDEINAKLQERGSDIETYVRLQLRAFNKSRSLLRLSDIISFGKYQGEIVETVARADPAYIEYIIGISSQIRFDPEVPLLVNSLLYVDKPIKEEVK